MIVSDASIVVDAFLDSDQRGHSSRALLIENNCLAPAHLDVEVLSSVRRRLASGGISTELATTAVTQLPWLDVKRIPLRQLVARVWQLRHNVTPYDAAYVALAEMLDAPLYTADKGLATATGVRCQIKVIE